MPEGGGGGHPGPQAGERARTAAHHHGIQIRHGQLRIRQGGKHIRGEAFGVGPGVDGDPLGQYAQVVTPHDAGRHGRGGGVEGEDDCHEWSSLGPPPRRDPDVGMGDALQPDVQMTLGEPLDQALAPFHHHDSVVEIAVQVQ